MGAPLTVSVGTTVTAVLPANITRKGVVVVNTSANVVSLGLDGFPAVLGAGITLFPGGSWTMNTMMEYTPAAITAIASAAGSTLSVQEFQ